MTFLASLREAPAPTVAVEFAAHRVSAASLDTRGGHPVIAAHATEPLPPGALVPALTGANIVDREAVLSALVRVFERMGSRPRRVAIAVPDAVARVSLVRFEQVPPRAQDLAQLVRWQVKKAAPFPIEEAQVTYVPGLHTEEGQEFIVALARRDIVAEYEAICAAAGAHAGIVDLATFNIVNAVLAAGTPSGPGMNDWLLVNVAPDSASVAVVRGEQLIFFRNRPADAEGVLADLVHQTAMYYEDRLKGAGFSRVILAGAAGAGADRAGEVEHLRRSLEERVTRPVELVDPRPAAAIADRIAASPPLLDTLAPLVGLLLRGREVAA